MISSPLLLAVTVCAVFYILFWWSRRQILAASFKIPGPFPLPLIGNALLFSRTPNEIYNEFVRLKLEYGYVIRMWLGSRLYVGLHDPRDVQLILGNPKLRNRDARMVKALSKFVGEGLLTAQGEQWRRRRKLITPTFHFNVLNTYAEIFGRKCEILVGKLEDVADGRVFDVFSFLAECTLDAICETAIGTNMNTQLQGNNAMKNAICRAMELLRLRFIRPWLLVDWIYALTADGRAADHVQNEIRTFSEAVIEQKLREYRSENPPSSTSASSDAENRRVPPFIDMLIETSERQGSVLTSQDMRHEVSTLLFAGLDTSATTASCLLTLLGIHTVIQGQVHEELKAIFGEDLRHPTVDDLSRMHVVERCLKETLRLFPIVTLLPREIDEDIAISRGYTLPAGSTAVIFPCILHRDPNNFPDPDSFVPDRWLPQNTPTRHTFAYVPFGAGPRNCIGQKYAMMQMKCMISGVLRRFSVASDAKMEELSLLEISVVSKSLVGYNIKLVKH